MIVFLTILKWIGLVIAVIFGLALLVVALVLLVPVRYRAVLEAEEEFRYGFRCSFLFPLFYVKKDMDGREILFYSFGIPIRRRSHKMKKEETPRGLDEKKESDMKENNVEGKKGNEKERNRKEGKEKTRKPQEAEPHRKKPKEKKNPFSFDRISSIMSFIRDRESISVFWKLKRELAALIRYLSPTDVRLDVRFGTGDPALTGLLTGVCSLMPCVYGKEIHIVPDFEERLLRGNGRIKGRMHVIYFIRLIIRLYRDEECKRVWKRINKKEAI